MHQQWRALNNFSWKTPFICRGWMSSCIVPYKKGWHSLFGSFNFLGITRNVVKISCFLQSTFISNTISLKYTKFLVLKNQNSIFGKLKFFFSWFYMKIHRKILVTSFLSLIVETCKKHPYTHLSFNKHLQKGFIIPFIEVSMGAWIGPKSLIIDISLL